MNKNKLIVYIISIIIILMLTFITSFINNNNPIPIENGIVVSLDSCWDGDTSHFYIDGKSVKVRFIGIDTPEVGNDPTGMGKKASDFVCSLLKDANQIVLEQDPNSDDADKFGRSLYWVWIDGKLLEEETIKNGYGRVRYIYDDYKYVDRLYDAQDYAKSNNLGIWNE